jgi:aminoglycoside 3-N-acetyltransferase
MWTRERIVEDLREMRLRAGDAVLVHASMRAVGPVEGGADTLVDALIEVVGAEGVILVPSFNRRNRVNEDGLGACFELGPCREQVGILGERAAAHPDAHVSSHPTLAFSAIGRNAEFLTASVPLHYPLGENSPLARLYQLDGRILLIGVGHEVNAAIHLAECWADAPYARRKATVRMEDGSIAEMEGSPECSAGFTKIERVLRQARIIRSGYVGNAPSQSMRMQHAVSMAREMLRGSAESLLCDNPGCAACTLARRFTRDQNAAGIA